MSPESSSSNPFRRKSPAATLAVENSSSAAASSYFDESVSQLPPLDTSNSSTPQPIGAEKKIVKKVRVQSPPPSSPEGDSIPQKPPTPIPRHEGHLPEPDPFDHANPDTSSDSDDALPTKSYVAPANPFQKTLANLEGTNTDDTGIAQVPSRSATSLGKGLDVGVFKRLLMTGDSGMAPNQPARQANVGQDWGSTTDASSISRQSVFESIVQNHPESPLTPEEVSDADERRRLRASSDISVSGRKKPPPPNSRHGKLIKIELRDDASSSGSASPGLIYDIPHDLRAPSPGATSLRSMTDLNKPLPAAPARASHESDSESVFDQEAAGKLPEPPSPTLSTTSRRKGPPAPPTRRHSQLPPDFRYVPSPTHRLSANMEETEPIADSAVSKSQHGINSKAPPPPPPSRRPASARSSAYGFSPEPSGVPTEERLQPKSGFGPPVPPTRMGSIRPNSGRPPSIASVEMSGSNTPKRGLAVPPPPPPRQRASSKTSVDAPILSPGSSRPSGEYLRRSIESARRGSGSSHSTLAEKLPSSQAEASTMATSGGANDILAGITALQKEIDALRGQTEPKI